METEAKKGSVYVSGWKRRGHEAITTLNQRRAEGAMSARKECSTLVTDKEA